jgi:hypothetical protein
MLRNHRSVIKTLRHNRGTKMTGIARVAGMSGMEVGFIDDVEFYGVERRKTLAQQA